MLTLVIVLVSTAAYVVIGARYAHSRVHHAVAAAKREWDSYPRRSDTEGLTKNQRTSVLLQLSWRLVFWPAGIVKDTCAGAIGDWLLKPHTDHVERVVRLRADARTWAGKRNNPDATPAEREVADQMVKVLSEHADDLAGKG